MLLNWSCLFFNTRYPADHIPIKALSSPSLSCVVEPEPSLLITDIQSEHYQAHPLAVLLSQSRHFWYQISSQSTIRPIPVLFCLLSLSRLLIWSRPILNTRYLASLILVKASLNSSLFSGVINCLKGTLQVKDKLGSKWPIYACYYPQERKMINSICERRYSNFKNHFLTCFKKPYSSANLNVWYISLETIVICKFSIENQKCI